MSPVSSSSSLFRQQRPQPSHRLSHSASDISSNVLVFQKNPSWSEGRLGAAVIEPSTGFTRAFSRSLAKFHLGPERRTSQAAPPHPRKRSGPIRPIVQNRERDHWFMVPARLEQTTS